MKVCITSYGPTLDSKVQPIFGRCEYFVFVDPVSMESVVESNPYASCSCEAGVESAKLVIGKGGSRHRHYTGRNSHLSRQGQPFQK
jgi:predicted Fe-Mo cluster-binding NifX family protein